MVLMFAPNLRASENLLNIADILKEVESNNNPNAIGDGGDALGVLQIHEACIVDVNRYFGTEYTHSDATNPIIAEDIFIKYITLGIKLYKKRCGEQPTNAQIVRMWNGGIYRGYEYESTKPYLAKYLKVKERYNKIVAMSKHLKKTEAVSKFKLEFLPNIKEQHGSNEVEYRKAWDYWKGALYKASMIGDAGLNWTYPKEDIG